PGAEPGYDFIPLLTVGREVPEIQGSIGNFSATGRTFAMTGIPDGMGLYETPTYNYLFLNHEFGDTVISDISSTIPGQIQGARVSLFVFDKNMNIVGGKNLIQTATDTTGTFTLDTTSGNYVNAATGATLNFSRFCSGYLAASGFVDANGNEVPIYFAPEETTNIDGSSKSRGWAVTPDGNALALDGLGRYAKEQVYSASQYRATNSDKTVLFGLEDFGDGELYMYVGNQTEADPNGFQSGQLYALKVTGHDWETLPEDAAQAATWTAIPQDAALDPTGLALNTFVNTPGNTTNFRRLEDMHEDPNNPGTFYFVTTGRTEKVGSLTERAATPAEADNPYGKLYRLTLNPTDPTAAPSIELVQTGGLGSGVSYDNVTVDTNGNVLLQEDETAFGGDVMTAEGRDGQIWSYNIATDTILPIGRINEEAEGSQYNSPAAGEWESSGIIEFLGLGANKNNYLFNVQAHTLKDETLLNGRHVEGGQILAAIWRGDDVLTGSGGQAVFGNQGDDELISGGTGSNVLYGGKDDDTLTGLVNDVLLGEKGDDVLIAGSGGNNTLAGGEGGDRFVIAGLPATPHVIADFESGEIIAFQGVSGVADFASLSITQSGADALIATGSTNLVRLTGVQAATLTSGSFEFS
ncbi:MAG TPA: DUF839 domain-containing protein, partial [Oscillatoriales cyanobacterium M59_W2019_021]|nr:DUF839 domain-containing protein [Oscillatoriales cyanobacterium M59_W2019_021]